MCGKSKSSAMCTPACWPWADFTRGGVSSVKKMPRGARGAAAGRPVLVLGVGVCAALPCCPIVSLHSRVRTRMSVFTPSSNRFQTRSSSERNEGSGRRKRPSVKTTAAPTQTRTATAGAQVCELACWAQMLVTACICSCTCHVCVQPCMCMLVCMEALHRTQCPMLQRPYCRRQAEMLSQVRARVPSYTRELD